MASREVNTELNLTPYIGLFAVLVVVLLLTAVFNNVLVLKSNTSASTAADDSTPPPKNQKTLNVTIHPNRVDFAEDNQSVASIPHVSEGGEWIADTMNMLTVLNQWRQKFPDKTDIVLNTENSVTYRQLILVFDTLVGNGWPDVGVNTL